MHGPHCVRYICLDCQNKYFLIWIPHFVNKSILFGDAKEILLRLSHRLVYKVFCKSFNLILVASHDNMFIILHWLVVG